MPFLIYPVWRGLFGLLLLQFFAVCCYHEDGPQIYYRKKRNQRNLGTRQKKPGFRGENLQKNDGPGHLFKGRCGQTMPVQITSSSGSGSKLLIAGPGVWLRLRSGLPSSKALLQNKAVIETIPSRPPFPKILMSITRGRWEVEKQSIGWKVLRMCINLLMPNAEPEGQCVVIMFAVCSFRYLVAVVVGDT